MEQNQAEGRENTGEENKNEAEGKMSKKGGNTEAKNTSEGGESAGGGGSSRADANPEFSWKFVAKILPAALADSINPCAFAVLFILLSSIL